MHEHACFDAPWRSAKYIWQSVQNIWIKKTDGFDCYQSTPSVFSSPANPWTVTILYKKWCNSHLSHIIFYPFIIYFLSWQRIHHNQTSLYSGICPYPADCLLWFPHPCPHRTAHAVSGIDVSFIISLHLHLVRKERIQSKHPSCPVPYNLGISISPY